MNIEKIESSFKENLEKSLNRFYEEMGKIRSGRVHTSMVENIKSECYGTTMPLNQLATISAPDPKTLIIEPWDKSNMDSVIKTLHKANLGASPTNDGNIIRLNFPPLSEERRKENVKVIKKIAEDSKVTMRRFRRESLGELKKIETQFPKDEIKRYQDRIQKELSTYEEKVSTALEKKSTDLMKL